jgi:hypothetical protein
MSQSSEFCRHNPLCCFSTSVYCCKCIFCYRFSPETFEYTLVWAEMNIKNLYVQKRGITINAFLNFMYSSEIKSMLHLFERRQSFYRVCQVKGYPYISLHALLPKLLDGFRWNLDLEGLSTLEVVEQILLLTNVSPAWLLFEAQILIHVSAVSLLHETHILVHVSTIWLLNEAQILVHVSTIWLLHEAQILVHVSTIWLLHEAQIFVYPFSQKMAHRRKTGTWKIYVTLMYRSCICNCNKIFLTLQYNGLTSQQFICMCSKWTPVPLVQKNGKVVPVLLLTEHHAMKAYCGVEV